jgi:hypothetical protein
MITLTDKDKEMLNLWDQGASSSEVANHFGITRNAVMGRLNRLRKAGFVGYKTTVPPIYRVSKKTDKQERSEIKEIVSEKRKQLKYETGFTLMELEFGMCRYPTRELNPREYFFCGQPTWKGSYCEEHHNICLYPAEKRERSKQSVFVLKKV